MRTSRLFIFLPALLLWLAGCSPENELPPTPVSYTTLIYMAADNSMDKDVEHTLDNLKKGAARSAGKVVVYLDRKNAPPHLFKITEGGQEIPLKSYPEENSADAATLARIVRETKELEPSDRFGLVFWTHSMGWVPAGYYPQSHTRYIGIDDTPGEGHPQGMSVMEIDEITKTLPDNVAEYIWFDVCLMGSVEALYAFRNKADYLIASPTEVLLASDYDASGAPYAKILPYLFGGKEELKQACNLFYAHYNGMRHEILRSASIALVEAKELNGLYAEAKKILSGKLSAVENMNTEDIQTYHTKAIPQVFFDLDDFVGRTATPAQYTSFKEQLSRTVIYKAATPSFMVNKDDKFMIDPAKFSGLSTYIPLAKWKANNEYPYYFGWLEWAAVYE